MSIPGNNRTVFGVLLPLILVVAAVAAVGATGRLELAHVQVAGQPTAILEEVPGPDAGAACALDAWYVDEPPEGLRPDVLGAWQRLRAEAGEQGVRLCLQDGKRSTGQQQREFTEAVRLFGTPELAGIYVLPPEKSMHVKGIAIDVQPAASAAWVERNGHALGWCRSHQDEYRHFEYDPAYATAGCPAPLPVATGPGEVPGPETGPVCPLDKRYVDEEPQGPRPDVLDGWKRLRAKAETQGVRLCVQDSKRSVAQQQREFTEAVRRFGTPELAARYVLPPEKSMHVKGIAVDIQPTASAAWVEGNGRALGWCRRYENEYWHFEYDPAYETGGCPAMLPSATGS
ncbi:D-alanyl-D-alanine carboxypeptidase family protein [Amycolatopsis sp.]|uniref:D-alanyl-D-alanine carboxypeptidase family protein n=1 Tax=Amycolatopsis sp. TaxID=37632 RepID=UPI002E094F7D|nr:D-alanyl-D-alanine carboxypeptidase family protein [Amycolatopsis sp.]